MTAPRRAVAGTRLPPRTVTVGRADLRRYADASGDHNPIHLDDDAARALGLPGVVAHGMLTAALALGVVAEWAGGADRVVATDLRFASPLPVPPAGEAEVLVEGVVRSVEVPEVPEVSEDGVAAPGADAAGTGGGRLVVALTVTHAGVKLLGKAMVTVWAPPDTGDYVPGQG